MCAFYSSIISQDRTVFFTIMIKYKKTKSKNMSLGFGSDVFCLESPINQVLCDEPEHQLHRHTVSKTKQTMPRKADAVYFSSCVLFVLFLYILAKRNC